jgi:hypothetical protein
VKWPARCTTMKCVNRHLNQVHTLAVNENNFLNKCLWELPVTEYGDSSSGAFGYLYTNTGNPADAFPTTGFDYGTTGAIPSFWAFFDHCSRNTPAVATRHAVTRDGVNLEMLPGVQRPRGTPLSARTRVPAAKRELAPYMR